MSIEGILAWTIELAIGLWQNWLGFLASLDAGDKLTFISIVGAVITFWIQHLRTIRVERTELYQRLETNSLTVFAFEAEHAEVLEKFRDEDIDEEKFASEGEKGFRGLQAHYGSMREFILNVYPLIEDGRHDIDPSLSEELQRFEKEWRISRKYYEQTLNLFEMATRFRHGRIIEPVVFGSWVIWFYDTFCEWSFRVHWKKLKENYTPDLRDKFNLFVEDFDPDQDERARKQAYFTYIGDDINCPLIKNWLRQVAQQDTDVSRRRERLGKILNRRGTTPGERSRARPGALAATRYRA